jgi:hypothetical protein
MLDQPTTTTLTHEPVTRELTAEPSNKQRPSGLRQRIESLLRKIFEGHEEYFGCTPD